MLTIFQHTNPDVQDEYAASAEALKVGDLVDDADQVVAVYHYYPIALGVPDSERVQLAIIHPADEAVPPKEEWYCWTGQLYSPLQCLHLVCQGEEVLRIREKPAGQTPELGKALIDHYFFPNSKEPKLDRSSVAQLAGEIKAIGTGLILSSSQKHIGLDAPYQEIYTIQVTPSPVLQTA